MICESTCRDTRIDQLKFCSLVNERGCGKFGGGTCERYMQVKRTPLINTLERTTFEQRHVECKGPTVVFRGLEAKLYCASLEVFLRS